MYALRQQSAGSSKRSGMAKLADVAKAIKHHGQRHRGQRGNGKRHGGIIFAACTRMASWRIGGVNVAKISAAKSRRQQRRNIAGATIA
jgi:hypothetical protein